jgi:hypothetical protein
MGWMASKERWLAVKVNIKGRMFAILAGYQSKVGWGSHKGYDNFGDACESCNRVWLIKTQALSVADTMLNDSRITSLSPLVHHAEKFGERR